MSETPQKILQRVIHDRVGECLEKGGGRSRDVADAIVNEYGDLIGALGRARAPRRSAPICSSRSGRSSTSTTRSAATRTSATSEKPSWSQAWANKAKALASYARQAEDDTLRKLADRIQARAVRRAGQLLKTFQTGPKGGRPKSGGGTPTVSQRKAAADAGMSKDQQVTAVRVANVPEDIFEVAVESDAPPTVTKLAEIGKRSWEVPQGSQ
jgi:hypothetical protein